MTNWKLFSHVSLVVDGQVVVSINFFKTTIIGGSLLNLCLPGQRIEVAVLFAVCSWWCQRDSVQISSYCNHEDVCTQCNHHKVVYKSRASLEAAIEYRPHFLQTQVAQKPHSNRSRGLELATQNHPSRAKFQRWLHAEMFVYILKQVCDITKPGFAFTVHVTSSCQTDLRVLQTGAFFLAALE